MKFAFLRILNDSTPMFPIVFMLLVSVQRIMGGSGCASKTPGVGEAYVSKVLSGAL